MYKPTDLEDTFNASINRDGYMRTQNDSKRDEIVRTTLTFFNDCQTKTSDIRTGTKKPSANNDSRNNNYSRNDNRNEYRNSRKTVNIRSGTYEETQT